VTKTCCTKTAPFFVVNREGRVVMKPEPRRIILKNVDTPPFTHYAMCEPVDFNGDGQWEVLAGFDRGTIYYWRDRCRRD